MWLRPHGSYGIGGVRGSVDALIRDHDMALLGVVGWWKRGTPHPEWGMEGKSGSVRREVMFDHFREKQHQDEQVGAVGREQRLPGGENRQHV